MSGPRQRAALRARLEARRPEIEQAALARVYAVADPNDSRDPVYVDGLKAAVSTAVDYGLDGVEGSEDRATSIPPPLLIQARLAARCGISLDTVLRRYFGGYTLLGDYLVQEAEAGGLLQGPTLNALLRTQAARFDQLVAAVSNEYARAVADGADTAERRRAERVRRLLDGELADAPELGFDFDAHHLGLVVAGPGGGEAIRRLATDLGRRHLLVRRGEAAAWAWLSGRHELDLERLDQAVGRGWPGQISLAVGEPGHGLTGWRLTHRQAAAALPIALRAGETVVRYADVALLASVLQDDLLATSLRKLYLEPLSGERDHGEVARATLRAYFAAGGNVSSAAADLGVSRQAVGNRLQVIEEKLGRRLDRCAPEVELALRLEKTDRVISQV